MSYAKPSGANDCSTECSTIDTSRVDSLTIDPATIGSEGIELHRVLAADDDPVQARDLAEVRQIIEEWYEPMSDAGFTVFAAMIKRRGWGRRRLLEMLYRFLEHKYPRWTPGDFVGAEPQLYPLAWYRERVRENSENAHRLGWYRVEGCDRPLCGWKHEVGDLLPAWEFPKAVVAANRETLPPREPFSRALPPDVDAIRRLNLAELRVQDLEREGGKLRRELALAQQTICEQAVRIAELEHGRLGQVIADEPTMTGDDVAGDAAMDFPFIPAKHFWPGRERFVDLIVIHVMDVAETAEELARYFQEPTTRVSAHLCIDDRSIVQCVRFEDTALHCRNANADGIGIVHVRGPHAGDERESREEWFDERGVAMLDLSAWAAASLCKRYNIPVVLARFAGAHDPKVVQRGFVGHRDVPRHGDETDPGEGFPWEHYLDRVRYHLALMD